MKRDKLIIVIVFLVLAFAILILITGDFGLVGNVVKFENNAFAQICSDTDDGLNFFVAGQVKSKGREYNDSCNNDNFLREYYCLKGLAKYQDKDCRELGMTCSGGKCFREEGNFFILAEGADLVFAYSFIAALNALGYEFDNSIIRNYNEFQGRDISNEQADYSEE